MDKVGVAVVKLEQLSYFPVKHGVMSCFDSFKPCSNVVNSPGVLQLRR
jgi:hypothetical protein